MCANESTRPSGKRVGGGDNEVNDQTKGGFLFLLFFVDISRPI